MPPHIGALPLRNILWSTDIILNGTAEIKDRPLKRVVTHTTIASASHSQDVWQQHDLARKASGDEHSLPDLPSSDAWESSEQDTGEDTEHAPVVSNRELKAAPSGYCHPHQNVEPLCSVRRTGMHAGRRTRG